MLLVLGLNDSITASTFLATTSQHAKYGAVLRIGS